MPGPTEVDKLLQRVLNKAKATRGFDRKLEIEMRNIVDDVTTIANKNTSTKAYCLRFVIPESDISKMIPPILGISEDEIRIATATDWDTPLDSRVKTKPYVMTNSFIYTYAAHINNTRLASYALALLLFRNWNGVMRKAFPKECNPEIMAYVIANIPSKQFIVSRYANPLDMIEKHFVPTLMKAYFKRTQADPMTTKRVSDQSFSRISQLFYQTRVLNLITNRKQAKTGLSPLYYQAHKNNNRIRVSSSNSEKDIVDFSSVHSFADITSDTLQIMRNTFDPEYSKSFRLMLSKSKINVKKTTIEVFLTEFYSAGRNALYEDIISLMLTRLGEDTSKACSDEFYAILKRKIVSSKHNSYVNRIKGVLDRVISDIFQVSFPSNNMPYDRWSNVRKANFREILTYIVGYYISQAICSKGR